MKNHRHGVKRLFLGLIAGGIGVFLMLPMLPSSFPLFNRSAGTTLSSQAFPPNAPEPSVQELLETTYLGHAEEYPDPEEPEVVLEKYVGRDTHKYLEGENEQKQELEREIAEWEILVAEHPQSRHALARLAELYRNKAELMQDKKWSRKAADHYLRAAEIGLSHGRIRYTRELSELFVELNDKAGLDDIFKAILAQPRDVDRGHYYQALVDYGDGLAQLNNDQRAWGYFEDAIDFHPEQNIEAINRYTRHLLDRGQAQQAFNVLDNRLTPEARVIYVMPAHLRKEAMEILNLDTTLADEEVAVMRRRVTENEHSTAVHFVTPGVLGEKNANKGPVGLFELLSPSIAQALPPPWRHSNNNDDCRIKDWQAYVNFCDSFGNCFTPMAVNLAELIDNEAKTESPGARYTVGWTAKSRAFEALTPSSCGAYNGAYGSLQQTGACLSFPCGDPAYCAQSQRVCCTVHGGAAIINGTPQTQTEWEDTHVSFSTLVYRGTIYAAWYVLDGYVPDPATGWIPSGVSNCSGIASCGAIDINSQGNGTLRVTSGGPFCATGANFFDPDPNGPMEYLNHPYEAVKQQCKWRRGAVCANGTVPAAGIGDNYFWNRKGPSLAVPIGYFDGIDSNYFAWGWALDSDTPSAPINIHVYIDGPAGGGGTFVAGFAANQPRADVNQATSYPGNHGWSWVIPAQYRTAPHTYYAYALDQTGTYNPQLSLSPRTR